MKRSRVFTTLLLSFAFLIFLSAAAFAQPSTMTRTADVVSVKGDKLSSLAGQPIENIGLFAKIGDAMTPVPFQVDQYDESGNLVFPFGPAKSEDTDPNLDANDELYFMAADSGDKATDKNMPSGVVNAIEIELTDPVDQGVGWVYLLSFGGACPVSDVDYVRYDAAANKILAENYTMGFSQKAPIAIGHLSLTNAGGGDDVNQADRLKIRFDAEIIGGLAEVKKNEDGFTSQVIAWIDGPVRVVRRTKNRQTLFWKIPTPSALLDNIYYSNMFEFPTRIDLPFDVDTFLQKPDFRVSTDSLCSISGRFFMNELNPEPVAIDGKMSEAEKNLNKNPYKWMVVGQTGANKGGWMNRLLYDAKSTPAVPKLYYVDDMATPDPPEEEPGQCGDVGYRLENLEKVEKGVLRLTSVMYNIPDFDKSLIPTYLNILDSPIKTKATPIR